MEARENNKVFVLVNPESLSGNLFNNFITNYSNCFKEHRKMRKLIIFTSKSRNIKNEIPFLEKSKTLNIDKPISKVDFAKELKVYNKGKNSMELIKSVFLGTTRKWKVSPNPKRN
jgi:hypothetical protein